MRGRNDGHTRGGINSAATRSFISPVGSVSDYSVISSVNFVVPPVNSSPPPCIGPN